MRMNGIEIVEYEPQHAYRILKMNGSLKHPDFDRWASDCKSIGPAFTLLINTEPAMAAGIILMGCNRGEAWVFPSPLFYKHKKLCYAAVKEYLFRIIESEKLRRVQAVIDPCAPWGESWMKHLGFEMEGILKKYGPNGEDMIIYGRV